MTSKTGDHIKRQSQGIGLRPFNTQVETEAQYIHIGEQAAGKRRPPQGPQLFCLR